MTFSSIHAVRRSAQKLLGVGLLLLTMPQLLGGAGSGRDDEVHVPMHHAPTGTAVLDWTKDHGGTMTVVLSLSGLAPNSIHPAHIHAGTCADMNMQAVEYALNSVIANAAGQGTSRTSLTGLKDGIPTGAINVHNGPTLAKSNAPWQDQYLPIACGNVSAPAMRQDNQAESAILSMTPAVDQQVNGTTVLKIEQGNLIVTMTLAHLQPNSRHVAHIHTGSCASQGPIKYLLNTLSANSAGDAMSQTTIHYVSSIPRSGWYINVHLAPTMEDLATQTGFAPIACGNVMGAS